MKIWNRIKNMDFVLLAIGAVMLVSPAFFTTLATDLLTTAGQAAYVGYVAIGVELAGLGCTLAALAGKRVFM